MFWATDLFRSHDIDMTMFSTLTDSELDKIGVKSFGARKIMLNAIVGKLKKL